MYSFFLFGAFPDKGFQDDTLLRLSLGLVAALLLAYVINRILSLFFSFLANVMASRSNPNTPAERLVHTKRAETLLSIAGAVSRVLVVGLCLYLMWRLTNPTSAPVAIIGAGTFFILVAAATVGPLLRDVTNGVLMIAEKWYNVGDHIVVDPFWQLSGIVEKVNLRSTKLRSINGEVVWIHNQFIQGVRVTPRGVRTISIDTFVSDLEKGRKLINTAINSMPTGPTMIATPLAIREEEQHGSVWRITTVGQTSPGREWLIEDFAVKALAKADERASTPLIVHGPIVRYTDTLAEKRFKHSMSNNK
ncbi:MAG: mechanosensitive ion channel domain-containing protein [Candidatus Saccharimonadales bacterium]